MSSYLNMKKNFVLNVVVIQAERGMLSACGTDSDNWRLDQFFILIPLLDIK